MRIQWIIALAALPLASCGQTEEEPAPAKEAVVSPSTPGAASAPADSTETLADAAEPAKLAQCKTCHSFEKGGPARIGPNLWGIHGKPAATAAGFAYSSALKNSGIVWDDAALDAYLADPRKTVPGGKMSFAGLKDPADRKAVVEYLGSLKSAD